MMNILVIHEDFAKYFRTSENEMKDYSQYQRMMSLNFFAIERKDGTFEIIKNRYNHTKGVIPKEEFQILMKYAIGEYYYVSDRCTDCL